MGDCFRAPDGAGLWGLRLAFPAGSARGWSAERRSHRPSAFRRARPLRGRVAFRRSTLRLFCPRRRASGRRQGPRGPTIRAASAPLRRRRVQPFKAAGHSAGGRLGRGLPSAQVTSLSPRAPPPPHVCSVLQNAPRVGWLRRNMILDNGRNMVLYARPIPTDFSNIPITHRQDDKLISSCGLTPRSIKFAASKLNDAVAEPQRIVGFVPQ